ncbi:hypothetical protein [Streptomyces sp. NPDC101776]|uniref:hypothetical protein n=1 Tax=Streptomyces sp. NPDC101776 TaxID=3366146 RepID=UPI00381F3A21
MGKSSYGYDDAGNLVSTTDDAKQIELDYTYDLLGRKLTASDKSKSNFQFASWLYDTKRIGLPTSSTRYVQGTTGGYTIAATGYTALGQPTGTTVTLPTSETPLPSTYTTTYTYTINDQLPATQTDPSTKGLSSEVIDYDRDALGNPTASSSGSVSSYVSSTVYTDFGAPSRVVQGASTNRPRPPGSPNLSAGTGRSRPWTTSETSPSPRTPPSYGPGTHLKRWRLTETSRSEPSVSPASATSPPASAGQPGTKPASSPISGSHDQKGRGPTTPKPWVPARSVAPRFPSPQEAVRDVPGDDRR